MSQEKADDKSPAQSAREPSSKELLERAILGDGKPSAADSAFTMDELSSLIPGFEFLRILGTGGMGTVYEARQVNLDRIVAVKLLKPSFCPLDDGYSLSDEFRERFKGEARAMALLKHPNIVTVHDFGITDQKNIPYLVMELVEGGDLAERMAEGPMAPLEVLAVTQQICDALQYSHERGLIHRDIKPANVLLTEEGVPKLTDFGLSKLLTHGDEFDDLTVSGEIMGTPEYMAPEQSKNSSEVDHRADVFSVGVLLYEMLTSERLRGSWRPPSQIRKGIPSKIDSVVAQSTETLPDDRIQSAGEVGKRVGNSFARESVPRWLFAGISILGAVVAIIATVAVIELFKTKQEVATVDDVFLSPKSLAGGETIESEQKAFETIMSRSKGIVTDQFAFYLQMSPEDFRQSIPPKELGYRPEIMRIWPHESGVSFAGIWKKEKQEWAIGFQLEEKIVDGVNEEMTAKGWTLTDFPPGYLGESFAIWTKDHPRYESTWPGIRNCNEVPWVLGSPQFHPHQRGCADFRMPTIYSLYGKLRREFKPNNRVVRMVSLSSAKNEIESILENTPNSVLRSVEWAQSSQDNVWIHVSRHPNPPKVERRLLEGTSRQYLFKRSREFADNGWVPFDLSTGGERTNPHFLMIWERPLEDSTMD